MRIHVYDTGLASGTADLASVGTLLPLDVEQPDADGDGEADDPWVGHGRAISSEIAALAPGAAIENAKVMFGGVGTDFSSAQRLVTSLQNSARADLPHLLVASFGTMACDREPGVPGDELFPVSLRAAAEAVDELSVRQPNGMLLIASAGNHGTTRRSYPAAFESVLAVGALDVSADGDGSALSSPTGTGPVAGFSARGAWIDVYAPGTQITTMHVDGISFEPGVTIEGTALVDGTSFAAPAAAGFVAELMSEHRIDAACAAERMISAGAPPAPPADGSATVHDLGPGAGIALLAPDLPSDAAVAGDPVTC